MSISRRASRNFYGQLGMLAVSFFDRIIFTGLLIRAWGTALFSDWATLLAAAGMLMVSEFGFQVLLGNNLVRAARRNHRKAFDRLIGIGMFFYGVLAIALFAGVVVLTSVADTSKMFGLLTMDHPGLVFLILASYTLLRLSRTALTQVFRGEGQVHQIMWTEVRSMAAIFAIAVLAVLAGADPAQLAFIYLGVEALIGGLLTLHMVRRRFPAVNLHPRIPKRREVRELGVHLPWYGWLSGSSQMMVQLPVLIVAWLGLGGTPLAALVLQRTLVNFGKTFISALSLAIGIEIADEGDSAPASERSQTIHMLAHFNVALAAVMAVGLLLFGGAIVGVWTGKPELGSWYILFWLLLPVVVCGPAIPLQMVTFYGGNPRPQAIATAVFAGAGLALAVAAGARFGVAGVAFGVGFGEALGIGLVLPLFAAKVAGINYPALLRHCVTIFVVALLWSGAVGLMFQRFLAIIEPIQLALALACWIIIGVLPVLVVSMPRNLRDAWRAHVMGLMRRNAAP